jgi:hypothetical protein
MATLAGGPLRRRHRGVSEGSGSPPGEQPSGSRPGFAARIGEVSGCRVGDLDTTQWIWTVRRQTTPAPGGLTDKGTKGKRARKVPIVEEIRPLVAQRILSAGPDPDARLFTGPRGGRISTAVLRDATPLGRPWSPSSATSTCAAMTSGTQD